MLAIVIVTREGRQYCTHFIAGEVEAETSPGTRPRIRTSVFLTKAGSLSENRKEPNKGKILPLLIIYYRFQVHFVQ